MINPKPSQTLEFVGRQLSELLSDRSVEEALDDLSNASPDDYEPDIQFFETLLTDSAEPPTKKRAGAFVSLGRLLPAAAGNRATLFREFVAYITQSKIIFSTYWSGVVSLISYLAAVSVVALVVGVMYTLSVIDAFEAVFTDFGADLPEATQIMFAVTSVGLPYFAVILAILVAAISLFALLFHRRIQTLTPLPRVPAWLPIAAKVTQSYNYGLFLNYARMLINSGVEPQRAFTEAASASNQDISIDALSTNPDYRGATPSLTQLGIAVRLGRPKPEVDYQCEQFVSEITHVLVTARNQMSLILKIALYWFVASLVIAMYLPIFNLGAIV